MRNLQVLKTLLVSMSIVFISLTGCGQDLTPTLAERDQEIIALKESENKLKTDVSTLTAENKTLKSENEQLKTENTALLDKYKDLSDSEISAQTEANKRKAEEDRLETERIQAAEKAKKDKEEADKKAALEAEARKGYDTGITYSQLARTPDDYKGKKVKFYGRVVQVVEGDNEIRIRLSTAKNGYEDVIYGYYNKNLVSSRILDDDKITIYGTSQGLYTYETTMGSQITIPLISIDKIDQ